MLEAASAKPARWMASWLGYRIPNAVMNIRKPVMTILNTFPLEKCCVAKEYSTCNTAGQQVTRRKGHESKEEACASLAYQEDD